MLQTKKPLHSYEQSMLLSAMLFDAKNLSALLKFLPEDQAQRMLCAKDKFLTLPRNERMTQIVLELRRLLLIDEHPVDFFHKSWLDDALKQEPAYLRPFIEQAIATIDHETPKKNESKLPLPLIARIFVQNLTKAEKKTAIYDPALMRLQSLKDETQDDSFSSIGTLSVHALLEVTHKPRLTKYLAKKSIALPSLTNVTLPNNPFAQNEVKKIYLRELIKLDDESSTIFLGLLTTAFYLSPLKAPWQRAIVLCLRKDLGETIEHIIARIGHIGIDQHHHQRLSRLLMDALDKRR